VVGAVPERVIDPPPVVLKVELKNRPKPAVEEADILIKPAPEIEVKAETVNPLLPVMRDPFPLPVKLALLQLKG
jgi:hypothetical protein